MKRVGYLIPAIADLDNLRLACWKAAKGKRHSRQVLAYTAQLDANLWGLHEEIINGRVQVGNYRYFTIYEPKERQICASAFNEQVLHHALMNICHPYFERYQIADSYASRKGKGVYAALDRAWCYTKKYPFFLKLDVKKFFDSIHHAVLKVQLARQFKDPVLLGIFGQIIDSYQALPGRGVPIGNLTSQYFANHYLAGLDHHIKEVLRCKAYVRYMDDMVLWDTSKDTLKGLKKAIEEWVSEELACSLKPSLLNYSAKGLPFLGYRLLPDRVRLLQKSKQRFIRKLGKAESALASGVLSEAGYQQRVLPLLAFVKHAHTWRLRQSLLT